MLIGTKSGIYLITCDSNSRAYVGQTSESINKRTQRHMNDFKLGKHKNPIMQSAWNKYGSLSFKIHVLENIQGVSELNAAEIEWEKWFSGQGVKLMNIRGTGDNRTYGPESRAKMSLAQSNRSQEWKDKNAAAQRGHVVSEETRAKIRVNQTGKKMPSLSSEHRALISRNRTGNKIDPSKCPKNHDNWYIRTDGCRVCRVCRREGMALLKQRRRS
jgi:group I intron endonuclease